MREGEREEGELNRDRLEWKLALAFLERPLDELCARSERTRELMLQHCCYCSTRPCVSAESERGVARRSPQHLI